MAESDYQSSPDERADATPTADELQAAELAKTKQALLVAAAMQQSESQLPSRLPTQPAPVQPPAAPLPMPVSRGRMYMGPASGPALDAFTAGRGPSSVNLMPPPSGPPPSRLEQAQAQDAPGSRTIGINDEPPYSDASMANQRNSMIYEAMKKIQAGDTSAETRAIAMGGTGRTNQLKTHFGPNGQVLQQNENGQITEIRPPDEQKVAATKPNTLLEKTILQLQKDIAADRRDLAKKPLVEGVPDGRPAMLHKKQQDLAAMTDKYNQSFQPGD